MTKLRALTGDEIAALQRYAAKHGRRWKSILNSAWMGHPSHDDGGLLRSLRNTHGPSWLIGYRLPKPEDISHAFAFRSGEIGFGPKVPEGAISVLSGPADFVRERVSARARHAYDGKTLLVPGLPEAENDFAAEAALHSFRDRVRR